MRFEKYTLYKIEEGLDELGNLKPTTIKVADIDVSISIKTISEVSNDVLYQVKSIAGLTKYSNLNEYSKYILSKDNKSYNIKSFIFGRLTQLNLEEVLKWMKYQRI